MSASNEAELALSIREGVWTYAVVPITHQTIRATREIVLDPIQHHTVIGLERGDCTIDGNGIAVKHERRLWPPKLGEAGEGRCVNVKNSMTKYGRGTHCCEVLKCPFIGVGTQSPCEGPNALVALLVT
jgi:hypothetical protein